MTNQLTLKGKLKQIGQKVAKKQAVKMAMLMVLMFVMVETNVFATTVDTSSIDNIIKWMAEWSTKIGLVVAFFGGIQTAMAFKNDDADAKVRGLKTLASGFMVAAISQALDLFGI